MRSLIVLAAIFATSTSFAAETKLGNVVAVEQSVAIDLAACEAAWKQTTEYGFCEIKDAALAATPADLASIGSNDFKEESSAIINLVTYGVEVGFQMGNGAYYVYALKFDSANTVTPLAFSDAKSHLEAAMKKTSVTELSRTLLRYE